LGGIKGATEEGCLQLAVCDRRQIDLEVKVIHVALFVDYLHVLTCYVEKLNLETINDVMEINFCLKTSKVSLSVLQADEWVEEQSVLIDNQVAHYLSFRCAHVNHYQ
jgi:hypothetical protein